LVGHLLSKTPFCRLPFSKILRLLNRRRIEAGHFPVIMANRLAMFSDILTRFGDYQYSGCNEITMGLFTAKAGPEGKTPSAGK
jgi:hypothetical protein